ncbi:MAG: MFS transporter [Bacteroidales bacterium]|nr:MFS transporter [Bacteroidales bacterium]
MKNIKTFPRTFWIANIMELFERWAWYGMFILLALYLTGSTDEGMLGFSQEQKGVLMGTVVGLLYFLPTITGAIADRFGYKKVLIVAYIILSTGYLLMGTVKGYGGMWFAFMYLAVGAALFKPVISATISKTSTKETASIGFGIFYMIVNVGAFIGPYVASELREISWNLPFIMASAMILLNLILVIIFYKEPPNERVEEPLKKSIGTIFKNIYVALTDIKFLVFLIIIVGFWTMYNQLFYTLPVFIEQWVDTTRIYEAIYSFWPGFAQAIGTDGGTILAEKLVNIDAMYIVIFQVLVSSLVIKIKPLNTMITGFLLCTIGISLWFITMDGRYLFLTILIFAVGEMAGSPKILEYIGNIAPKDKVALYMGCYFIPMSGGNFFAGLISGNVYGNMSDKVNLVKQEIAVRGLSIPDISGSFTQNAFLEKAANMLGMTRQQMTQYLWETYHPQNFWMVCAGIGLFTVISLFIFDRLVLSKSAAE